MKDQELLRQLAQRPVVALSLEELGELLESAETWREIDTRINGWIRILGMDGAVLIQEQAPDGDVLVRRVPALGDAEVFVESRLVAYERQWDGCGCRIDYHS